MILGFLKGVAETLAALNPAKHGRKTSQSPRKLRSKRSIAARPRIGGKSNNTMRAKTRTTLRRHRKTNPQPIEAVKSATAVRVTQTVLGCPACGLQAPESLMTEHFRGSPTHEHSHTQVEPTMAEKIEAKPTPESSEDESRERLRSLLQILVPPRAFGRRREQRTINPLSQIVRTIDSNSSGGK